MKKSSIIIGRQPLIEAISSGRAIDKILLQRNVSGESIGEIRKLAREKNIPLQQVPAEKLHGMTRSNHQGVIAFAALIEYINLQQAIDFVVGEGKLPFFVMLDGVTDVRNIGGIARTAVCCGTQLIIIPDKGIAALNEEAVKASAGALEKIHVCRVGSLLKAIDELHLNGIRVFTTELNAKMKLPEIDFGVPCCVVMGSEDKGVQAYISKAADQHFSIPMQGDFDSLNVSVATGIVLYEAMRQRMAKE
ncbi:MAG: 23S rRNA (guanosine(2251)-2'-O)-methyltransferase RlmB [Bacteroidetes bacterium]|nr:MAG: 23S rRNA (guanosine(2251)-2'-O)-methyltransferase RlmB [Bacteroidota bacterium]